MRDGPLKTNYIPCIKTHMNILLRTKILRQGALQIIYFSILEGTKICLFLSIFEGTQIFFRFSTLPIFFNSWVIASILLFFVNCHVFCVEFCCLCQKQSQNLESTTMGLCQLYFFVSSVTVFYQLKLMVRQ